MLFAEFFTWWYGRGFIELFSRLKRAGVSIWSRLSVGILLRTLFDPWKRIVTDSSGSITDKSRALLDNTVSRFVGFSIRFIVIISALVIEVLLVLFGIVAMVAWPLAPLLIPLSFLVGLAR